MYSSSSPPTIGRAYITQRVYSACMRLWQVTCGSNVLRGCSICTHLMMSHAIHLCDVWFTCSFACIVSIAHDGGVWICWLLLDLGVLYEFHAWLFLLLGYFQHVFPTFPRSRRIVVVFHLFGCLWLSFYMFNDDFMSCMFFPFTEYVFPCW